MFSAAFMIATFMLGVSWGGAAVLLTPVWHDLGLGLWTWPPGSVNLFNFFAFVIFSLVGRFSYGLRTQPANPRAWDLATTQAMVGCHRPKFSCPDLVLNPKIFLFLGQAGGVMAEPIGQHPGACASKRGAFSF